MDGRTPHDVATCETQDEGTAPDAAVLSVQTLIGDLREGRGGEEEEGRRGVGAYVWFSPLGEKK